MVLLLQLKRENSEDAPIIGVKKDTDGIYYWTLDGEWLTDEREIR
jgi:hypothetical protein